MTFQPWPTPPPSKFAIEQPPVQLTVVDQGQGQKAGPPPSAPYQKRQIPMSAELDCEICDRPNTWRKFYVCSDCKRRGCAECVTTCSRCDKSQCDECQKTNPCCIHQCTKCGRKAYEAKCPQCEQIACSQCVYECRDCGKTQCQACAETGGPCCNEMADKFQTQQSESTQNSYEFISDPGRDSPESVQGETAFTTPIRGKQPETPELRPGWGHKPMRIRFPESTLACNKICPHCLNSGVRSYCTLLKNPFHDQHMCSQCNGFVDITGYDVPEDWEMCEMCHRKPVTCKCSHCVREICDSCEISCNEPKCIDPRTDAPGFVSCKKCLTTHQRRVHNGVPTPDKEAAAQNAARLKKKSIRPTQAQYVPPCGMICENCLTLGIEAPCQRGKFHPGPHWCPSCHFREGCGVCAAKHEFRKACHLACGKAYCYQHISQCTTCGSFSCQKCYNDTPCCPQYEALIDIKEPEAIAMSDDQMQEADIETEYDEGFSAFEKAPNYTHSSDNPGTIKVKVE